MTTKLASGSLLKTTLFRVDKSDLAELRRIAKQRRVSLSSLVREIIRQEVSGKTATEAERQHEAAILRKSRAWVRTASRGRS
jgi:Ribbon-helix-helix protein, copG family